MYVHLIHDLGQEELVRAYAPVQAICGMELREAHEVAAPEAEAAICEQCLSQRRRNRYQNYRAAVEMSARASEG